MALSCDWIDVPGGAFWMGGGPRDEENPRHLVTLPAYRLASSPVTRAQYQEFLDEEHHEAPEFWLEAPFRHPMAPAAGPSWLDAQAFCAWYGRRTGEEVRLPTEAEWERAARGGRDTAYPWGNEGPGAVPAYDRRWQKGPEPVNAYPSRHPWGFFGLGENVHEWCLDWYDRDYYADSPSHDPRGPEEGRRRSSRGGSWRHAVKVTRCAARSSIPPHLRYADYGFRLRRESGDTSFQSSIEPWPSSS